MNVWQIPGLILIASFPLTGCTKSGSSSSSAPSSSSSEVDPVHGYLLHAQPRLPTIKVWLGNQELTAEIARQPVEIATGMMFRTNMPENEAMLFVFPDAQPRNFYMRNCVVPLSAAYISPDGEILEIIQLQPHDETGVESRSNNIQFVLEVPQGWFKRHNVPVGTIVRTERGSLIETFTQSR